MQGISHSQIKDFAEQHNICSDMSKLQTHKLYLHLFEIYARKRPGPLTYVVQV